MASQTDLYLKYDKVIDDLYEFRDKYYILNPKSNADDRNADLTSKLNELLPELDSLKDEFESKSAYLVMLGRAHNVMPDFCQKAFDALSKAVKLDPRCYVAWNYLGECYWKQHEFESSRNCFQHSLNIERNKLSLRGLSMVTRHLGVQKTQDGPASMSTDSEHSKKPVEDVNFFIGESLKFAKEALKLDIKDGMSWYILANSYLAQFFSPLGQQSPNILKQAMSAYNQALKDPAASLQSDLYFNKSMTSMYEENWKDVLACLKKSLELDPSWHEARDNLREVLNNLDQIQSSIENHGKLKTKKFQNLISSIRDADAGPYARLSNNIDPKSQMENKHKFLNLELTALNELKSGLNEGKLLIGKVISGMPTKISENFNMVCFICCIADSYGNCAAMTIYNLHTGEGCIIGDSVAIPEPWLENVDFTYDDTINGQSKNHVFNFKSIRISNPSVLVVNGKKWTKEKVSSAVFVPKVLND